jgi:phage internal scaffolding protein
MDLVKENKVKKYLVDLLKKQKVDIKSLKEGKNIIELPNGKRKIFTLNSLESMTDGSLKDEVDTKNIVKKYKQTGMVSHVSNMQGTFSDVSAIPDYFTIMSKMKQAEEEFSHLPSQIRKKFDNDPAKMIDWLKDPKNDKEAVQLGLKAWVDPEAAKAALQKEQSNGQKSNESAASGSGDNPKSN